MKYKLKPNTLYLVTDSDLLHKDATSLEDHVEKSIIGGVDVVQLREKHADTGEFIALGKRLLVVCKKHNVPLVINDRVDVAVAIGADGIHVGQDDMDCAAVRQIVGPDIMIGVSVNNLEETVKAVRDGADYVGIGAVYDTATKALTKPTMGTLGVQEILQYLSTSSPEMGSVAIGGVNAANIDRIMHLSSTQSKRLDGIALVSAIMTSSEPEKAARGLKNLMSSVSPYQKPQNPFITPISSERIIDVVCKVREMSPLVQQMTNNVVKNFSANVTIAVGASPAMSEVMEEAADFAKINGALLINMGMVSTIDAQIYAVQQNNKLGKPVLLDPVGAGATQFRRQATRRYLNSGYFDVIKGNEAEIRAVSGLQVEQKGVDNISTSDVAARIKVATDLSQKLHNIIVITGIEDIVSDGKQAVVVSSGHRWLGEITGSGCSLGSTIASFLAANIQDKFLATIAAITLYGIAAEDAAEKESVLGPGTFVPAFIDSLYRLSSDTAALRDILNANSERYQYHECPGMEQNNDKNK